MVVGGIVSLSAFWFTLKTELALTNQKLDYIAETLTNGNTFAQANRGLIIELDKRVQRLKDTILNTKRKKIEELLP